MIKIKYLIRLFLAITSVAFPTYGFCELPTSKHVGLEHDSFQKAPGFSAEIISFTINSVIPDGSYLNVQYNDIVELSVEIENTSSETMSPRSYWLGISFKKEGTTLSWPDGYYDLHPIESPIMEPSQIATITLQFAIPHFYDAAKYNLWIALWDDYNNSIPLEEGAMIPNPNTGEPYDRISLVPIFEVINSNLADNPFNIAQYDKIGIYNQIPKSKRNLGLEDLAALHGGMRQLNAVKRTNNTIITSPLNSENKKLIIAIHGWMPYGLSSNPDPFSGGKWGNLVNNISSTLSDPSWSVVEYSWYNDALVNFFSEWDTFWKTNPPQSIEAEKYIFTGISIGITSLAYRYTTLAKISAYKAYQHGLMIARKLEEQVGLSNLEKVQIICHSAGSWAGIALTQFLGTVRPGMDLQLIYLDPFIPSRLSLSPSYLLNDNVLSGSHIYTKQTLNTPGSQAYWTSGGVTNIPLIVGPATEINWSWNENQGYIEKVDNLPNASTYEWANNDKHDIPVFYYGSSIMNPTNTQYAGGGWIKSLAYNDIIDQPNSDPIIFNSITTDKDSYLPGENATLSVTLANQLPDATVKFNIANSSALTLNEIGNGVYRKTFTAPTSAGSYSINITAEKTGYLPASANTTLTVNSPNAGHDFAVTHMYLDKNNYYIDEDAKVTARVDNVGSVYQSNVAVVFRLINPHGSVVHERQETVSLSPGQWQSFTKSLWAPNGSPDGSYTVEVRTMLPTDNNPANDFKRLSIYMGEAPAFAQYYNSDLVIIKPLGASDSSGGYTIKLIKIWDSYDGKAAAEVRVSRSGYTENMVIFLGELSFFDGGRFVLELKESNSRSQEVWIDVFTPSSAMTVSPQRLYIDAGSSGVYNFSTSFNRSPNISARYEEHASIVNNWLKVENFSSGKFELKANVPLNAKRQRHKFWASTSSGYLQYLEIDVKEPHNVEAIHLTPAQNASFISGEVVEITGTFYNKGGYDESGTLITLNVSGPGDYNYSSHATIDLLKGQQIDASFSWNTAGLPSGSYSISLEAIVHNDPFNNNKITHQVDIVPAPSLMVNKNIIQFGEIEEYTTSPAHSFNLEWTNITGDIIISSSSANFRVSTNEETGFKNSLIINSDVVPPETTIWVRFTPGSIGERNGVITIQANEIASQYVSVAGVGIEPLVPLTTTINDMGIEVEDTYCFDATQTITISNTIVEGEASVIFIAGRNVRLMPGTHFQAGSHVHAYITQNNTFCGNFEKHILAHEDPIIEEQETDILISEDVVFTGIPTEERAFFRVFPNPTGGSFTVELTGLAYGTDYFSDPVVGGVQKVRIDVYSILGARVISQKLPAQTQYTLSLADQLPGVYIVRVKQGSRVSVERLVKR